MCQLFWMLEVRFSAWRCDIVPLVLYHSVVKLEILLKTLQRNNFLMVSFFLFIFFLLTFVCSTGISQWPWQGGIHPSSLGSTRRTHRYISILFNVMEVLWLRGKLVISSLTIVYSYSRQNLANSFNHDSDYDLLSLK